MTEDKEQRELGRAVEQALERYAQDYRAVCEEGVGDVRGERRQDVIEDVVGYIRDVCMMEDIAVAVKTFCGFAGIEPEGVLEYLTDRIDLKLLGESEDGWR